MPVDETNEVEDTQDEVEAPEAEADTEESEDTEFDAEKARAKIRKINSENRNLRKREADALEKAKGADETGAKLTALEAENLRLRIGVKHGLPESIVKRLSGTTEEELLADAEELMELLGGKRPPTQQPREKLRGGGDPTQNPEDEDIEQIVAKVFSN